MGNDWRQRNGTLGAAMRLHALRQAPPETTKQPKTPKQQKNNPKTKGTIPNLDNTTPAYHAAASPPPLGTIRGKLGEPRGACGGTHAIPNPTPPTLVITCETTKKTSTNTVRPSRASHGKTKAGRGKAWATELNAGTCMNPPSTHNTTCTTASQYISSTGSQHPIPRAWGAIEPGGMTHPGASKRAAPQP